MWRRKSVQSPLACLRGEELWLSLSRAPDGPPTRHPSTRCLCLYKPSPARGRASLPPPERTPALPLWLPCAGTKPTSRELPPTLAHSASGVRGWVLLRSVFPPDSARPNNREVVGALSGSPLLRDEPTLCSSALDRG